MNITLLEIGGYQSAIKAMRLPKKSFGDSKFTILQPNTYFSAFNVGDKDMELAKKLILAGDEHAKCMRGISVWFEVTAPWYWFNEYVTYTIGNDSLGSTSTMHIDCKGLLGEELQKAKSEIKGDFEYTRVYRVNYQMLRRLYFQRRNHRLPEWKVFCNWIKTLPLAEDLITLERTIVPNEEENEYKEKKNT